MDATPTVDFLGAGVDALTHYITIPCISPDYDASWEQAGHLDTAVGFLAAWAAERSIPGLTASIERLAGRTPLLFVDIPASTPSATGTVVLYGHFDKQPPLGAWGEGLDPFVPVIRDGRLYGRGSVDDGYATFASLLAIEALAAAQMPYSRIVLLIEGGEESGSPDLDAHLDALGGRLGTIDLMICLDSGALTYDRLWLTQSLRGNAIVTVEVRVLDQGVHSGEAGGVVPSSFRILRQLLDRIEDPATGTILIPELHAEVPPSHHQRFAHLATELGDPVGDALPTVSGLDLHGDHGLDRMIRQAWMPAMAVTGMDGIPSVATAGNVLRASTTAKLSFRLPPSVDGEVAVDAIVARLTANPPHGASVTVQAARPIGNGWVCPDPEPWLDTAIDAASEAHFGRPAGWTSEGGSIPFLAQLGQRFPDVTIIATGALGPGSHAHGPDESLHLDYTQRLSGALASLLAAFARRPQASS